MLVVMEGGHPWGFRIEGGAEIQGPLRINKVTFHFYFAPCDNSCVLQEGNYGDVRTKPIRSHWFCLSKYCILSGLLHMFLKDPVMGVGCQRIVAELDSAGDEGFLYCLAMPLVCTSTKCLK